MNPPLHIVQLVENLDIGGLERFTIQLAAAQQRAGCRVTIYCLHQPGALAGQAEAAGLGVRAFHKKPGFSFTTIWRMSRALRQDRAQVLHGHNPGVHHYGALAARLAGVRAMVNTRHGVSSSSGTLFQERWFRMTLPLTQAVVFVSEHSRRFYEENRIVSPAKSVVIHNGILLEPFETIAASPGSRRPKIRFGTVGRLAPVKGHLQLLEAFVKVRQRFPQAELQIVGGGPLMDRLREESRRLGIDEAIELSGPLSNAVQAMAGFDVFVLSSTSEGLPMVILEALVAGLPIVSTRVGGVPEVAPEGEVAWYCEPGDAEGLAAQMIEAASCAGLGDIGKRARGLARERYGIDAVAARYVELYRRVSRG